MPYKPIINVLDLTGVEYYNVCFTRRDDQLWWKFSENHNCRVVNNIVDFRITKFCDTIVFDFFQQVMANLLLFNDLKLDTPQKFLLDVNPSKTKIEFTYFLDADEQISIPPLPGSKYSLRFLLMNSNKPILKLLVVS